MRVLWGWWAVALVAGCGGSPFVTTPDAGTSGSSNSSGSGSSSGAASPSGSTGSNSDSPLVTPEAGASGAASSGSASGSTGSLGGSGATGSSAGAFGGSGAVSGSTGSSSGTTVVEPCQAGFKACPGTQCCLIGATCEVNAKGDTCAKTCTATTQCGGSNTCAPFVDPAGNPVGPFVCKPDDGKPYNGCGSTEPTYGTCAGTLHCYEVAGDDGYFCGRACTTIADCGTVVGVCCLSRVGVCGDLAGLGCSAKVCGPCP